MSERLLLGHPLRTANFSEMSKISREKDLASMGSTPPMEHLARKHLRRCFGLGVVGATLSASALGGVAEIDPWLLTGR